YRFRLCCHTSGPCLLRRLRSADSVQSFISFYSYFVSILVSSASQSSRNETRFSVSHLQSCRGGSRSSSYLTSCGSTESRSNLHCRRRCSGVSGLEHDPEKWIPVFSRDKRGTRLRGDHAQSKN